CYQLAMLLWSLWLATALVRWLPWAWRQLSYLGFWPAPANDAAMTDSDSVDKTDPAMTDEAQNVEVSHVEASHVEVMANDKSTTVPTTEIGSEEGKTGDSAKTPDNLDK
ncbi:MAG: hypothetical protein KKB45_06355, partial [Gammaproteobacteria bacterium]|nr:hypothetical protein [Gammaproteobacteria bacterium]